jgi:hypothetical protein
MGIRTDLDERQPASRPAAGLRALLQLTAAAASALLLLVTVATPAWAAGAALSPSFAGYQGPVGAKGTATIKVPAITCVAPTQFVAATVYLNDTASPYYVGAEIALRCTPAGPSYTAAVFGQGAAGGAACAPVSLTMPVVPGNVVTLTVTAGTPATATIVDTTTGTTLPLTTCGVGSGPVWVGMCAPSGPGGPPPGSLPNWCDAAGLGVTPPVSVPRFGTVKFFNVFVNSLPLPPASPRYNMKNAFLEITTGTLTAGGTAFATRWLHA